MEQEVNVRKGKNLVCKHRNEISREIQNRLKAKVSLALISTEYLLDVAMIIKCHSIYYKYIYCSGQRGEDKDGGEEVSQDGRGGKEKGARTAEEGGGGSH